MVNDIKDKLSNLVTDFHLKNINDLVEEQTRQSFIDPFWEILGWKIRDMNEVQVELTEHSKRPDYRFMKKNKTLFFVEAKRPRENLKNNLKYIYQAKIYCWNGNVPLAVLTDFEEFRPFRSYGKPNLEDREKGIIKQFDIKCDAYPDRAYDLLNTFGKEAVYGGSLNEIIQKPTPIELRDTVDKNFLITLSKWRTDLATQIAKTNKFENEFDLAEAVQRILDRLVFLRILEDREIETEDFISEISNNKTDEPYNVFLKICKGMAPKYNGLIFNPHPLSENLKVEGRLFKKIVRELNVEDSPYRFDEIPVEMLGTIYERFLGDEINLSTRGKVVIDKKPEVRKAGGVYYTPQYIVEYIVQNTVGKLLENCRTPDDVAKLKILDPACGSGSFLLGAFALLIKWHEEYFSANPTKIIEKSDKQYHKLAYLDDNDKTCLTTLMKGRILKNNLFGVDLDKQATELAQMSLYIKCLDGLKNENLLQLDLKDALLPSLTQNIICGNSLIGSDFIQDDFFGLSVREKHKINPFDWEKNFPFIKETGGFDAVIGNPPYVKYENLDKNLISYYIDNFNCAKKFFDIFQLFLEKSFELLKSNYSMGFIFPNLFLKGMNYENSRKFFLDNSLIISIMNYGDGVFENVQMPTCVIIFKKHKFEKNFVDYYTILNDKIIKQKVDQEIFQNHHFIYGTQNICDKILGNNVLLKDLISITRGLEIGRDKAIDECANSTEILFGEDISRYEIKKISFISNKIFKQYKKKKEIFLNPKIVIRETGNRITAVYDENKLITNRSLYCIRTDKINLKYLLALINSNLIQYYYEYNFKADTDIFPKIRIGQVREIPIKQIDPKNHDEIAWQERIIELVDRMLKANKDKQSATKYESEYLEKYIENTDKAINRLVYLLYGLTEEEIKVVEGEGKL